jgi:hypothetical protein
MYIGETELERQARADADAAADRAINELHSAQIGTLPEIAVKGNPMVFYILSSLIATALLFPTRGKRRTLW